MSDEVNKMLEGKWFVVSKGNAYCSRTTQDAAELACEQLNKNRNNARYTVVQLQVKGTLPEGAIMPEFKVGDRVAFQGSEMFRVTGVKNVYAIESLDGKYGCGAGESELQPAPPVDPMRDEFEAWWASGPEFDRTMLRTDAYLIWQAAKAGAK